MAAYHENGYYTETAEFETIRPGVAKEYPIGTPVYVNDHDSYNGNAIVKGWDTNMLGRVLIVTTQGFYYLSETRKI